MNDYEVRTAADVMKRQATAYKSSFLGGKERGFRKRRSGSVIYDFCPYCTNTNRQNRKPAREGLLPLWELYKVNYYRIGKDEAIAMNEREFYCDVCKMTITEDDFLKVYSFKAKDNQSKIMNLATVQKILSVGKEA